MRKFSSMMLTAAAVAMLGSAAYAAPAPFDYAYEGDALPNDGATIPTWVLANNTAGSSASVSGGILTITDNTIADNHEYQIGGGSIWNPTSVGSTVEVKLDVVSNPGGDWANCLNINTGAYEYGILFGTNWVTVIGSGDYAVANDSLFHTYRFTTDETLGKMAMYIDDNTTPAKIWNGTAGIRNYISFGDNSGGNLVGEVQWDYIRWTNAGAFAPVVPEPGMLSLAGLGAVAMLRRVRR